MNYDGITIHLNPSLTIEAMQCNVAHVFHTKSAAWPAAQLDNERCFLMASAIAQQIFSLHLNIDSGSESWSLFRPNCVSYKKL